MLFWNNNGTGSDDYNFMAFPTGFYRNGSFYNLGNLTYFWTANSFDGDYAWARALGAGHDGVVRNNYPKENMYSCRCVLD